MTAPALDDDALVAAVLVREPAAERALDRVIRRAAQGAARRLGLGPAGTDEIAQRVAELLWLGRAGGAPLLPSYTGEAPLAAWLRVIAYREGLQLGRRREVPDDDDLIARVVTAAEPELVLLRHGYLALFRRCFAAALAGLSLHDRDLLRRHYLDGLSLDALGALHGAHRATAARWLARIRARLIAATRDGLRRELDGEVDLDQVLAVIGSLLEASLSRQLAAS